MSHKQTLVWEGAARAHLVLLGKPAVLFIAMGQRSRCSDWTRRWVDRSSNSVRRMCPRSDRLLGPPRLQLKGYRNLFPVVKLAGRDADSSLPCATKVQSELCQTCAFFVPLWFVWSNVYFLHVRVSHGLSAIARVSFVRLSQGCHYDTLRSSLHRRFIYLFIHSFRSLSYDRSIDSPKASSPHGAI